MDTLLHAASNPALPYSAAPLVATRRKPPKRDHAKDTLYPARQIDSPSTTRRDGGKLLSSFSVRFRSFWVGAKRPWGKRKERTMTPLRLIFRFTGLSSAALTTALLALCGCGTAPPGSRDVASGSKSALESSGEFEGEEGDDLLRPFATPTGRIQTFTVSGEIDTENPFFRSLGTNGRRCDSCHQSSDAWTITPRHVQARFNASHGFDPIFRKNDGANSPDIDDSTLAARRRGYSMLLNKGLIRIGIGIPDNAEFELVHADDPYHFASSRELSLFRRPLPSTNLKFLATVMWDGRETFPRQSIDFDLLDQSNGATRGHAQAIEDLTPQQRREIVDFEMTLFTAAIDDHEAGRLNELGARGGPEFVQSENFYIGINDVLGGDPTGRPFDPHVFTIFDAWSNLREGSHYQARAAVARGQSLFNTREIHIRAVKGLNDALGVDDLVGGCTTCHDTPNAGNHSVSLPIDIGLADESRRTPDMPLYTLRNRTTGELITTTDPGRGLITGRWRDISKFKGPILRALAARPPYFHNGFARDLSAVVDFYDTRFDMHLTAGEKSDLVAFLRTL
jgi:cytochrome c peroxidase